MGTPLRLSEPGWLIAQFDRAAELTRAEQRLAGRQTRGTALAVALAERLHPKPCRDVDLSDQWAPDLWVCIESVRDGADPQTAASQFTPYRGRGRRVVGHMLEIAGNAAADVKRNEWQLPLVRDALINAAPRGFACWSDAEISPVRRPKLEGEPYLAGARQVVRFGLNECLAEGCDGTTEESVRRGRHAKAALYCAAHVRTSLKLRAAQRDAMHNALEHASRFYSVE